VTEDAGIGPPDGGANLDWSSDAPDGCGCKVVGHGSDYGALAIGAGLLVGWGARRRKR
jgi:MYXO-CTERM domain-containing protein